MRWLLWKDYRHNRLIVYTALVLLLAPHLVALYAACRAALLGLRTALDWPDFFVLSSLWSLILCQAVVALIGGNAIAGERVDRSAEFLFSLPIARGKLLVSKLLLALAVTAPLWLTNALVFWCGLQLMRPTQSQSSLSDLQSLITNTAIVGMAIFCVAWFLSSFLASAAIAVCGGLFTPLFVFGGITFLDQLFDWQLGYATGESWSRGICVALSAPSFALGAWHYLRRVEP